MTKRKRSAPPKRPVVQTKPEFQGFKDPGNILLFSYALLTSLCLWYFIIKVPLSWLFAYFAKPPTTNQDGAEPPLDAQIPRRFEEAEDPWH